MPTFPLPLLTAALLGFLLWQQRWSRQHWLNALLGLSALQSLLIALVQHYGLRELHLLQLMGAALLPGLAWLALRANSGQRPAWPRDYVHLAAPLPILLLHALLPQALDAAIPLLYVVYAVAIWRHLAQGERALPTHPLNHSTQALRWWRLLPWLLCLSALSDGLIVLDHILSAGHWRGMIITLCNALSLLMTGLIAQAPAVNAVPTDAPPAPETHTDETQQAIFARVQTLLQETPLYLNPDLSLNLLARKLGISAKQVSAAINQCSGDNLSRFINTYRIEYACEKIRAGDSITRAMQDSGFHSKSNFNREFLRLKGMTPSQWRAQR